jgi:anaerobic nitric oxide reductase flavorubredoxin
MLTGIAGILEEMRGLGFKNKKAAAFGTYGWSGESVKMVSERLKEGGFMVVNDGLRLLWNPDQQGIEGCVAFGREFTESIREP